MPDFTECIVLVLQNDFIYEYSLFFKSIVALVANH